MVKSGTIEHVLWKELYVLYSHNSEPDASDEFWGKFHDEAVELEKKYRETECAEIAKTLILAIMRAIEQKEKMKK